MSHSSIQAKVLTPDQYKLWDKFVHNHSHGTLQQTTIWAKFQKKSHSRDKFWVIALFEDNNIIGGTLLIRHRLPKGYTWLYASRGPLLECKNAKQKKLLIDRIKRIARKENSIFLRLDPPISHQCSPCQFPKAKLTTHGFQPEESLILDLTLKEKDILAQMKPKGRYNIKLARKKGVEITLANPKKPIFSQYIEKFHEILQTTAKRDGFNCHPIDYYRNMIEILGPDHAKLYVAEYQGEIIAAILNTYHKNTATYYYGASSNEKRNLMAPYLLQWQAIQDAKEAGYENYDFLGITTSEDKNHPWHGITQFKSKFGGKTVKYHKTQELPFKKILYLLYRIYKKMVK